MRSRDIIHHFCTGTKPAPKWKYLICIDPEKGKFLWINSNPRKTTPQSDVPVTSQELSFLSRSSYIDVSGLRDIDPDEIPCDSTGRPNEYLGRLSDNVRDKIIDNLDANPHIKEDDKLLIREKI